MDREDQTAQEARVEKLWRVLDTRGDGQLNLNGLKKGLSRMDHPLKNADSLLQDVMKAVDTNGDGHIEYSEFRKFVEQTEQELWQLFKTIDRDHNGQLDKAELKSAFVTAGIVLPSAKLDQFFAEVDTNNDGVISFDEWRNFLLFIPADTPNLRAVLSYYSSTVAVNAEGDVHLSSDESSEGLGKNRFSRMLFGALFDMFKPTKASIASEATSPSVEQNFTVQAVSDSKHVTFPWDPGDQNSEVEDCINPDVTESCQHEKRKLAMLTDLLPDPGYFIAGAISGAVSRTATAPLDRLKVFLISQVDIRDDAVKAVRSGAPAKALETAVRPLLEASKTLWRMGGLRSLYAGNGLNVIKIMPENAIRFGSFEASKRALAKLEGNDDPQALKPWTRFLAGGMGGMTSQFFIYPLDTLKFRLQNETVKGGPQGNALILATARKMWAVSGIRSFYKGLPMGLIGMFPYSAIDLTTYSYLKEFMTRRNARARQCHEDDAAPGSFMNAGMGAFSGAFGASVVYPINLLRTRLQCQGTAIHPARYNGVWDVAVKTVKGEGFRGLFKGLTPNLLKVVPSVSITYVVYENAKAALRLR